MAWDLPSGDLPYPIFLEKFLKFGIVLKCLNFNVFKCRMSKTSATEKIVALSEVEVCFFLCKIYANLRQLVVHLYHYIHVW